MPRESDLLVLLCKSIAAAVEARVAAPVGRLRAGLDTAAGETALSADAVAEQTAEDFLERTGRSFRVCSPERRMWSVGSGKPERLLVIDPIDGSAAFGGPNAAVCVSASACEPLEHPRFADVQEAAVFELRSGVTFQADRQGVLEDGQPRQLEDADAPDGAELALEALRWSVEACGRRVRLIGSLLEPLHDASSRARPGLVSSSAAFTITRLVTREIEGYVDVWTRMLSDAPQTRALFEASGMARLREAFPHDLAAGWKIATLAGVHITDGRGQPLDDRSLLGETGPPLQSCVAATSWRVHAAILALIGRALAR